MKNSLFIISIGMAWASVAMAGVIKVDYHAVFGNFGGFPSGTQITGSYCFNEDAEPIKIWPDSNFYPVLQHKASIGELVVIDPESEIGVADDIEHPAPSNLLRDRYSIIGNTTSALNSNILVIAFGVVAEVDAAYSNPALVNRDLPGSEEDLSGFPETHAVVVFQNLIDGRSYATHGLTSLLFTPINTAPGSDVVVAPETLDEWGNPAPCSPKATISFAEVIAGGNTSSTITGQGPPPPAGFCLARPPVYLAIGTDAVHSGPISLGIQYSTLNFIGRSKNLRLAQYTDEGWIDITDEVSPETSTIYGTTSELTLFTILKPAPWRRGRHQHNPPRPHHAGRRSRGSDRSNVEAPLLGRGIYPLVTFPNPCWTTLFFIPTCPP